MFKSDIQMTRRECLKVAAAAAGGFLIAKSAAADIIVPSPPPPGAHRVLSCNILLDLPEHKGNESWKDKRRDACVAVIKARKADIIGLQEVGRGQNKDFKSAFPGYSSFGFADPASDKNPPRFQAIRNVILYRNDRYKMTSQGSYWISKTPLIAGSGLEGQRLARHVTWVRLRDKSSGKEFRMVNTHWPLEQDERLETARMMNEEAAQYATDFPQVMCGDFNAVIDSQEIKALLDAGWQDTYTAVAKGPLPTERRKIDYVFVKGPVKPIAAELILDTVDGVAPSDHFFVGADVEI